MRKLLNGIKNLIVWFPIIWNDRDWDYQFLLEILRFKLKRMYKGLNECNNWPCHSGSENHNKRIKIAIELLDRQLSGAWYFDNAQLFGEPISRQLMLQRAKHEQSDWDFLMDLLKKYLRNWWD